MESLSQTSQIVRWRAAFGRTCLCDNQTLGLRLALPSKTKDCNRGFARITRIKKQIKHKEIREISGNPRLVFSSPERAASVV